MSEEIQSHLDNIWQTKLGSQVFGIPGFNISLTPIEAAALYMAASEPTAKGLVVELGAWYGASTVMLGLGCKSIGQPMVSVDTWRGTTFKKHWQWNPEQDMFPVWQADIVHAGLEHTCIPLRGLFDDVLEHWTSPIRLLYSDGYHTYDAVKHDVETWLPYLHPGGTLMIHDYHETPPLECDKYIDELIAGAIPTLRHVGVFGRIAAFTDTRE